jgi:hypothetical protein
MEKWGEFCGREWPKMGASPEWGICLGQIPNLCYAPFKGLHMCKELARNQMKCKMSFFQLGNKFGKLKVGIDRMFKLCSVPATIQSEGLLVANFSWVWQLVIDWFIWGHALHWIQMIIFGVPTSGL